MLKQAYVEQKKTTVDKLRMIIDICFLLLTCTFFMKHINQVITRYFQPVITHFVKTHSYMITSLYATTKRRATH